MAPSWYRSVSRLGSLSVLGWVDAGLRGAGDGGSATVTKAVFRPADPSAGTALGTWVNPEGGRGLRQGLPHRWWLLDFGIASFADEHIVDMGGSIKVCHDAAEKKSTEQFG